MYVDSYFEGTLEVAPFAGAWIEIVYSDLAGSCEYSRSLRGSVD